MPGRAPTDKDKKNNGYCHDADTVEIGDRADNPSHSKAISGHAADTPNVEKRLSQRLLPRMKFKSFLLGAFALALSWSQVLAQATILPPGETCFSALTPTSGGPGNTGTGFIGLLGSITGGSGYINGTYGGVPLTGGNGSNATANITVSGGSVTQVAILNPGVTYVVGNVLSASAANLGGSGSGFS